MVNVASHRAVTPDRRFFTKVNIANDLGTDVHISGGMNLRVNTTKRSDHVFGDSNIGRIADWRVEFALRTWVFGVCSWFLFSLRNLGVLCVSAIYRSRQIFTAETQRTPRLRRESNLPVDPKPPAPFALCCDLGFPLVGFAAGGHF